MGKNKSVKIRKGTKTHLMYEAVMTNPSASFSCRDIWENLKKDGHDISLHSVQDMVGCKFVRMGILQKTNKKVFAKESGRIIQTYRRVDEAVQPVILDDVGKKKSEKTLIKRQKKQPIPDKVTALELGEALIDYVNDLQVRLEKLALNYRSSIEKAKNVEASLRKEIQQLTYQIDGLKRNNHDLTQKLANKNRTFSTKEVLDFKRRKAQANGFGN